MQIACCACGWSGDDDECSHIFVGDDGYVDTHCPNCLSEETQPVEAVHLEEPLTSVVNLPTKSSRDPIIGRVHNCGYRIENASGLEICFIHENEKEFVAMDIASAIESARDAGFQQGLDSIRQALGIK